MSPIRIAVFGAILSLVTLACPAAAQKRIALTFDDVPNAQGAFFSSDQRTAKLIAGLRHAQVRQVAFFVNASNLEKPQGAGAEGRIARYAAAGHVFGNHGFSHLSLERVSTQAFLADLDKGQAWVRERPNYRPWFRFPYLNEGGTDRAKRDALKTALAQRGLQDAYATAEAADFALDQMAGDAIRAGKHLDMKALRKIYIELHLQMAQAYDQLAIKALGRSPAHVMLMHENDLAALFIADLVKALRLAGWEIIAPDEAYWDPIHTVLPDVPSAQGTLTEMLTREKGLSVESIGGGSRMAETARRFNEEVLHGDNRRP